MVVFKVGLLERQLKLDGKRAAAPSSLMRGGKRQISLSPFQERLGGKGTFHFHGHLRNHLKQDRK